MWKGRRKLTGQIVAMKFIAKVGKSEKEIQLFRQEIAILKDLKHENIVLLLDCFETRKEIVVVTEYGMV